MMDLSTYSLSDFLMFSPEIYFRLYERYNAALWPAQLVVAALTLLIFGLTRRRDGWPGRVLAALLAAAWLAVGWLFFYRRYAEIFLAAPYFAVGFGVQAAALIVSGVMLGRIRPFWDRAGSGWGGLALLLFAVFIHPFIGPLAGRQWTGVELFGLAPDPTAVGSLGLLLMKSGRRHALLMVLPVLWCVVSGLTYYAMQAHAALITPVVALAAVTLTGLRALGRRGAGAGILP